MQPGWTGASGADAAAWNTCDLGRVRIPGIVTVSAEKGRDVDFKKAKGQDGGTTQDNGATQGKVTIDVILPRESHWDEWQRILPAIDPVKVGGVKKPLEISHPEPNSRGIRSVYVTMIRGMPPTARGGKRFQIECLEWFPAPKTTKGAKKGAIPESFLNRASTSGTEILPTDSLTVLTNIFGPEEAPFTNEQLLNNLLQG
jgi:hypothetical protein